MTNCIPYIIPYTVAPAGGLYTLYYTLYNSHVSYEIPQGPRPSAWEEEQGGPCILILGTGELYTVYPLKGGGYTVYSSSPVTPGIIFLKERFPWGFGGWDPALDPSPCSPPLARI